MPQQTGNVTIKLTPMCAAVLWALYDMWYAAQQRRRCALYR